MSMRRWRRVVIRERMEMEVFVCGWRGCKTFVFCCSRRRRKGVISVRRGIKPVVGGRRDVKVVVGG